MHSTAFAWLKGQVEAFGLNMGAVLEVGSSQENDGGFGNAVRLLFSRATYWGIDRVNGPGVDAVVDIEENHHGPFNVVLSAEMLEHTPRPWLAVANMARCLAPGGSLLLTCRGFDDNGAAPLHMQPHDYYRFSRVAVVKMLEDAGLKVLVSAWDPDPTWRGVFAHAIRP